MLNIRFRIRRLQYVHSHASNAEFLDELLLFIGTMGEFIGCSSGIYCWLTSQKEVNRMEVYYFFVLIIHLIQVFLQSMLIFLAIRYVESNSNKAINFISDLLSLKDSNMELEIIVHLSLLSSLGENSKNMFKCQNLELHPFPGVHSIFFHSSFFQTPCTIQLCIRR